MHDEMEKIFDIENNEAEKLTEFIYDDFWIWTSIRIHLWNMITPGMTTRGSGKRGNPKLIRLFNVFKTFLNLREYIKILFMRKSDVLIFTYKQYRRDLIDGYHRDVYFSNLIEFMESKGIKYSIVSEDEDTFYKLKIRERRHVYFRQPFLFMSKLRSLFINIDKAIPKQIKDLSSELQKKYDLPIIEATRRAFKEYITRSRVYKRFIRSSSPNYVFMVPSITKESLISICKKKGIVTVESEHGTFVPMLHNYSDKLRRLALDKNLKTQAPDYYLSFGNSTRDALVKSSLIKPENVRAIGNLRIDYFKKRFEKEPKKDNIIRILLTSQFTVTEELIEFFNGVDNYLKDNDILNVRVYVKLHFNEMHKYDLWKQAETDYIKIYDKKIENSHHLFEMIQESDFVASVYSTTLAESISFNKPTIILKLWGWDYYKALVDNKVLIPVDTPEEFVKSVIEYNSGSTKLKQLQENMNKYNDQVNISGAINNYLNFFNELYDK